MTTAAVACGLTLGKFLVFNNNVSCVDLLTVLVGIGTGLDPSGHADLGALVQILLCEFRGFSEGYTTDKISSLLIAVPLVAGFIVGLLEAAQEPIKESIES